MNLQNIFSEIERTDPEIFERLDTRRNIMQRFKNIGSRLALTAIPVALGSMLNKAYGQVPTDIVAILNFALKFEYFECDYYTQAFANTIIDPSQVAAFDLIKQHEEAHITFLTTTITALGGIALTKPDEYNFYPFDPNNPDAYINPFETFLNFLTMSQAFEDLGVRAYKGQVSGLISNNEVLTAALQIHSVEARHASYVRKLRRDAGAAPRANPWITGTSTNGIAEKWVRNVYDDEDNVLQLGIELPTLNGVTAKSATECFDEPLTMGQVNDIIDQFNP